MQAFANLINPLLVYNRKHIKCLNRNISVFDEKKYCLLFNFMVVSCLPPHCPTQVWYMILAAPQSWLSWVLLNFSFHFISCFPLGERCGLQASQYSTHIFSFVTYAQRFLHILWIFWYVCTIDDDTFHKKSYHVSNFHYNLESNYLLKCHELCGRQEWKTQYADSRSQR